VPVWLCVSLQTHVARQPARPPITRYSTLTTHLCLCDGQVVPVALLQRRLRPLRARADGHATILDVRARRVSVVAACGCACVGG
jgi:hypothetical protein